MRTRQSQRAGGSLWQCSLANHRSLYGRVSPVTTQSDENTAIEISYGRDWRPFCRGVRFLTSRAMRGSPAPPGHRAGTQLPRKLRYCPLRSCRRLRISSALRLACLEFSISSQEYWTSLLARSIDFCDSVIWCLRFISATVSSPGSGMHIPMDELDAGGLNGWVL